MGSILTVISSAIIMMFFYAKLLVILQRHEVDIMTALIENNLTQDDIFGSKDGFFVAAALTMYDSNTEVIEDWRYGELIFSTYGWGYSESLAVGRNRLDYHSCSDEELGLIRTKTSHIYPLQEKSKNEVEVYKKKFKCIDNEDAVIWGDYNSAKA